jgi:high-affinity Fe2+/Pb2+ permease
LSGLISIILTVGMLAAFALVVGGIKLVRHKEDRGRGVLMLIAAAVLVGNVAILTL